MVRQSNRSLGRWRAGQERNRGAGREGFRVKKEAGSRRLRQSKRSLGKWGAGQEGNKKAGQKGNKGARQEGFSVKKEAGGKEGRARQSKGGYYSWVNFWSQWPS